MYRQLWRGCILIEISPWNTLFTVGGLCLLSTILNEKGSHSRSGIVCLRLWAHLECAPCFQVVSVTFFDHSPSIYPLSVRSAGIVLINLITCFVLRDVNYNLKYPFINADVWFYTHKRWIQCESSHKPPQSRYSILQSALCKPLDISSLLLLLIQSA